MALEQVEDTDLSDLDLLDDEHHHAQCRGCYPKAIVGTPFIAWCGTRALWLSRLPIPRGAIPAGACGGCASNPTCSKGDHR